MKKIFIFLFLISFTFLNRAWGNTVNFTVVSDVHLDVNIDEKDTVIINRSLGEFQQLVKEINKSESSFVIFLGDNLKSPDKKSLVAFAKSANKLRKPFYVGIGDKDISKSQDLGKKNFYRLLNMFSSNRAKMPPSVIKKSGNVVFIMMDGVNETIPGVRGYFREDDLIWLDKQLDKYKNKHVVIVQHYPLVEPYENDSKQTYNKKEYFDVLNKYQNVIAIIAGHYHGDSEDEDNGILHLNISSFGDDAEYKNIEIQCNNADDKCVIKTKVKSVR